MSVIIHKIKEALHTTNLRNYFEGAIVMDNANTSELTEDIMLYLCIPTHDPAANDCARVCEEALEKVARLADGY